MAVPFFVELSLLVHVAEVQFFSLLSLRFLTLYRSPLLTFRTCRWASDSSGWPKRGLASGTLQLVGRVPKRPHMLASRKNFPHTINIILNAS